MCGAFESTRLYHKEIKILHESIEDSKIAQRVVLLSFFNYFYVNSIESDIKK